MTNPTADQESPLLDDASVRRMASFAVMTVDWNHQQRSYLDNFLNYALAVVPADSATAFPSDAVRPSIIDRFNLVLPENIVQQLLRRAIRLRYLNAVGVSAVTLTDKGKREVSPISYTLKKLAQEQVTVAERFAEWAKREIGVTLADARATSILLDYVETYYCSLMSLSDGGATAPLKLPMIEPSAEQKMAAAFIGTTRDSDEELFESIANMARGSMMVSALYAPTLVDTTKGFRKTTVYLDTKIVLRALGYEGDPAEQSTVELLTILKKQGARTAVFDFTLREIRSVLDAVAIKARTGRIWNARPGTVESFFYRINASNAQIEQHSVRVEARILGLGIEVDPAPSYENHRFVIDESRVEEALRSGNPNYRTNGLKHDVELIASVVRARAGRSRDSLEESRATFMTLNSLVVATARSAQREYNEAWPLVMFESDVAALTWIKEPLAAPNLPKNQLLATSLGLMNPGKHDWDLYIREIGRLLESDEISDNDVILLRQKYEMDRLAFIKPVGISARSKKEEVRVSVEAAREAVAEELTAPIRAERDELTEDLSQVQREAGDNRAESDRLLTRLLRPIWKQGAAIKWGVVVILLVVCGVALLLTLVPESAAWLLTLPGGDLWLWGIRLVAVLAALAGGLAGPFLRLAGTLRRRFLLARLSRLSVEPDRAERLGFRVYS